jgi:hypothetical protein
MELIGCGSIARSSDRTNKWLLQVYCGNLARGLKRRNVTNTIEKHSKGEVFTELTCDEILAELRRFFTTHTYTRAHTFLQVENMKKNHTRARALRVERPPRACR